MTCDLREFVNREVALRAFAGLRGDPRRRILLVQGPEGIGKSCLLRRLRQDCHQTGTSFAMVDFRSDRGLFAARDVVLRLQEQIDGPFAAHLEKADLEFQTSLAAQAVAGAVFRPLPAAVAGASGDGGNRVTVGDEVQVTGDIFGGNKIVIRNSPITILPTNGAGLARDSRTARWNGAFQQALILAAAQGSLVLFFDSYEEALPDVADWLLQQLLRPVLEEMGDLANLWVVVAGRQVPLQGEASRWRYAVDVQQIAPFTADVIKLFWVDRRRLDPVVFPVIARTSAGMPALLAAMADNFASVPVENGT